MRNCAVPGSMAWVRSSRACTRNTLPMLPAVALGDPAGLARRVELFDEARGDVRHQRLEAHVPAVLLRIQRAVARHHPADVAGAVRAQHEGAGLGARAEQRFDARHRRQQLLLLRVAQRGEQGRHLVLRAAVQRREGAPAGGADRQPHLARVGRRAAGLDQPALLEAAQQPAQVAGVEVERARQFGGGGVAAVRQFPQQARFGQRELACPAGLRAARRCGVCRSG